MPVTADIVHQRVTVLKKIGQSPKGICDRDFTVKDLDLFGVDEAPDFIPVLLFTKEYLPPIMEVKAAANALNLDLNIWGDQDSRRQEFLSEHFDEPNGTQARLRLGTLEYMGILLFATAFDAMLALKQFEGGFEQLKRQLRQMQ